MASFHMSLKSAKKGGAARHSRYIAREGQFEFQDETSDLIAQGHGNLPAWAQGSPETFWRAADKYERANGAVYRELELALPNELTPSQNVALVEIFIQRKLAHKTYQYGLHCPDAAIGGVKQPHVHLMYSDRLLDGIDRPPEKHFRRFNPDRPELGGCRKDGAVPSRSALRDRLISERADYAKLQNEMLAQHGHAARVDHRSHTARGLKTPPEIHLGQAQVRALDEGKLEAIKTRRRSAARPFKGTKPAPEQ